MRPAIRYSDRNEFHRHVKDGGSVLLELLVTIWNAKTAKQFFKKPDMSNIWPAKLTKKVRQKPPRSRLYGLESDDRR
jgi:hypothetical protein